MGNAARQQRQQNAAASTAGGRHRRGSGGLIGAGDKFGTAELNNTTFNGQNDYLSSLWKNVSSANFDEPLNDLRGFIGDNGSGGAGGGGGGGTYTYSGNGGVQYRPSTTGVGGQVPDTMKQGGWVADHINQLWDNLKNPGSDPTLQPYIDQLTKNAQRGADASRASLDAQAEGSGRYGSGYYALKTANDARAQGDALNTAIAGAEMQGRSQNLGAAMSGLGTANERDLAAMQDATNRFGIETSANSAAAGAASAAALARRQQNLDAINSLIGMQQYGLGMQAHIGDSLNTMHSNALDNSTNRYDSLNSLHAAMAPVNFQKYMYNDQAPQRDLNNFLDTLLKIGQLGGTQHGQGAPPYTDPSIYYQQLFGGKG